MIPRATDVRAEFDVVIALDLAPVVDKLELVFILNQRAVAAVDAEGVTEFEQ